jgi:hypothetical protein
MYVCMYVIVVLVVLVRINSSVQSDFCWPSSRYATETERDGDRYRERQRQRQRVVVKVGIVVTVGTLLTLSSISGSTIFPPIL